MNKRVNSKKPTNSSKQTSSKKGTGAKKKKQHQKRWFSHWKKIRLLLNLTIWLAIALGVILLYFSYDLPSIDKLRHLTRAPGISFVSQKGELLATYGDIYGQTVHLKELPSYVPNAIIATEDSRFYSHFGVDVLGIIRAAWHNFHAGRIVQGGSTITQQLAKQFLQNEGLYSYSDRSLRRKVQEVLMALWLENTFTKDQILSLYMNRVYLGSGVYGIDAAAQKYFNKKAKSLNVYEAAVIAGLLKAPSKFSPASNPKLTDKRAQVVLDRMLVAGVLTKKERDSVKSEAIQMLSAYEKSKQARYFYDWVVESLPQYIGHVDEDISVVVTLDPRIQTIAEQNAKKIIDENAKDKNVSEVGVIAMSHDGAVKALVGGYNYNKSQYNHATQARRQPGSAFKLFVYLAALEKGYHPMTLISDRPIRVGRWSPKNYGWQSRGEIPFKDVVAYSINTSTVRIAKDVGYKKIIEVARRLGISTPLSNDLSIALGSGEVTLVDLTSAYATVANGGRAVRPYGVLSVRTRNGRLLYSHTKSRLQQVVKPFHAQTLVNMLGGVMLYGTGRKAALRGPSAGKTGTNQDYRDAWFVGFAGRPALICGVWVGNDNGTSMKKITGGTLPALLWHNFMTTVG
jgi:penicillin-binding protein 1A